MALDLLDSSGELDRLKVLAELDRLLDLVIESGDLHGARGGLVALLDEAQTAAYANGQEDATPRLACCPLQPRYDSTRAYREASGDAPRLSGFSR